MGQEVLMTTGKRSVHDFCFINLMTPDAAKAKAFFAELFGWTYGEMPGVPGGALIQVEGRTAGAVMDLAACPPDVPAVIGVMVGVESADATAARVAALGGRAEPAMDFENGSMAMCFDPNGAAFGIWQARTEHGFEHDSHAHGAPSWFETLTTDAGRAVAFYAELFGWKPQVEQMPGGSYTVFKLGSVPIAGTMKMPSQTAGATPHWGTYFAVKSVDETAKLGAKLGATVCMPPTDIPQVGRFALLTSPQGVPFHVITYAR
jgi:hypothetical protein